MKLINSSHVCKIPEGVTVTLNGRNVTVKGPRGEMKRSFPHQAMEFTMVGDGSGVRVEKWFGSKKELACVKTTISHIENMIVGVTQGYRYKMRFVYAHFPINVTITNTTPQVVEIRNFLGQKRTFKCPMRGDTKVERSAKVKDQIVLEGNDLDAVSQSAADIQQATRVRNKDIRKFLDGIYVSEKGPIPVEE